VTFLERLYELADEVGLVVMSYPHSFVTDADLIPHVPEEFAEQDPEVVTAAKAMIEAMALEWVGDEDRIAVR